MTTDTAALARPGAGEVVGRVATMSFEEFFAATWSDAVGYCAGSCRSRVLGEELAQEAFSRVYARWPLLREPRAYLFRVATNLCRRQARASSRDAQMSSLDDIDVVARTAGVDPHLLDAVRRLPQRLTEVVLLHYYADLSVEEVGHALRRPPGTVKRQLHEARALLATTVGDHRD